jgi:hypothetical protein
MDYSSEESYFFHKLSTDVTTWAIGTEEIGMDPTKNGSKWHLRCMKFFGRENFNEDLFGTGWDIDDSFYYRFKFKKRYFYVSSVSIHMDELSSSGFENTDVRALEVRMYTFNLEKGKKIFHEFLNQLCNGEIPSKPEKLPLGSFEQIEEKSRCRKKSVRRMVEEMPEEEEAGDHTYRVQVSGTVLLTAHSLKEAQQKVLDSFEPGSVQVHEVFRMS